MPEENVRFAVTGARRADAEYSKFSRKRLNAAKRAGAMLRRLKRAERAMSRGASSLKRARRG